MRSSISITVIVIRYGRLRQVRPQPGQLESAARGPQPKDPEPAAAGQHLGLVFRANLPRSAEEHGNRARVVERDVRARTTGIVVRAR